MKGKKITIILFVIGRVVIKMAFGELSSDKSKVVENNRNKVSAWMYIPQIIMLILVFTLGIYVPDFLDNIINMAALAF